MKNATAVYWILFWGLSFEALNDIVMYAMMNNDFEKAKLYCKAIAIKSMNIEPETFYNKYCKG